MKNKSIDIGLVMLVKDEARRIEGALAPILDQLCQVIVFDTGSSDGTPDILRERLRIEPIRQRLGDERFGSLAEMRNRGLASLETPWCLTLDADERLDPDGFRDLRTEVPRSHVGGVFLRWRNHTEHGEVFDDYKCALFRRGFQKVGLIHENVQPSLRRAGSIAQWSDAVVLDHRPEARKEGLKRQMYQDRLRHAMNLEPEVPRYPWFAGYAAVREHRLSEARVLLDRAAQSPHPFFPVERLNARVVLASLAAGEGDLGEARRHLVLAGELFNAVRDDFEVMANHWLEPWLRRTIEKVQANRLEAVSQPRFAC